MSRVEIVMRVERRRKWTDAEKAAVLAEWAKTQDWLTRSKMTHLRREGKEREYTTRPCRRC
jgi:hypothetical protein